MSEIDEIQALWKQQPTTPPEVDMDEIQAKADRFAKLVTFRNVSEWLAALFVVVSFCGMAVWGDYSTVTRVGAVLIALGAVFLSRRIYLDGRLRDAPDASQDTRGYIEAYRSNLRAQANLLRDVWRWYLGPLVPGLLVFHAGFIVADPSSWLPVALVAALSMTVFGVIAWVNRVAAKKLHKQADALPTV